MNPLGLFYCGKVGECTEKTLLSFWLHFFVLQCLLLDQAVFTKNAPISGMVGNVLRKQFIKYFNGYCEH